MAETKKKKSPKKKEAPAGTAPKVPAKKGSSNENNQLMSVVLFAFGILLLCIVFMKGSAGWRIMHNILLGMFGVAAIGLPIIMIYAAVSIGREQSQRNVAVRGLWGVGLAWCIGTAMQVFVVGEIPGDTFTEQIKLLFIDGMKLYGGGVLSYPTAGLLFMLFGKIGAKIVTILLCFIVVMRFRGQGLMDFLDFLMTPFRLFRRFLEYTFNALVGDEYDEYEEDDQSEDERAVYDAPPTDDIPFEEQQPQREMTVHIPERNVTFPAPPAEDEFLLDVPLPGEPAPVQDAPLPADDGILIDIPIEDTPAKPAAETAPPVVDEASELEKLITRAAAKKSGKVFDEDEAPAVEETPAQKDYILPSLDLLSPPPAQSNSEKAAAEMLEKAETIVNTLRSFGVEVKIIDIFRGPTITRYEIQPGVGVKVSKIRNLEDDIALSLAAKGVRIEAPVPGKSVIGIEVPNNNKDMVTLREILSDSQFRKSGSKLTFAVGKDIAGNIILGDIAKMPHVIIAGTTGSGKSVCTRSIIMSILYNATPEEVKIILIDPKIVEFKVFEGLPHLLIPIVTEAKKAAGALNWAVNEMMRRYQIFADAGANDLKSYNMIASEEEDMQIMPQIVIFIDELADMMLVAKNEVEDSIQRLAQMGRAAGMHLVVATQRPTTDVITGIIKANIPSRIALSVMSQVDSRTIIDKAGAEKLLGNGDMLYMPIGSNDPLRVQGCFASNKDINETLNFIKAQTQSEYDSSVIEAVENFTPQGKDGGSGGESSFEAGSDEDFIERAMEIAVSNGTLSTSFLQRKLKLGYARAARIMESLEEMGVVAPSEGAKPRKVLMSKMQYDERKLRRMEG